MHQLQIGDKVQIGIVFLSYMNEEFTTHFIINNSAKLLVSSTSLNSCVHAIFISSSSFSSCCYHEYSAAKCLIGFAVTSTGSVKYSKIITFMEKQQQTIMEVLVNNNIL